MVVLTPTPTPTAIATTEPKATTVAASDSGIVDWGGSDSREDSATSEDEDEKEASETPKPNEGTTEAPTNAVWEERRGSMF